MIGIKSVAFYRPKEGIDNLVQGDSLGASHDFIHNKIGVDYLTRKDKSEETTDLAQKAVTRLFAKEKLNKEQVDCMIFVTQNPDSKGLPHSSAILHHKLGLNSTCAVFDISLGCSGYVHGLHIAKSFMEGQGFKNGLLITCDPYSKIIDSRDRDTALLFGDAATVTWLSDYPVWRVCQADFGIVSKDNQALAINERGNLEMNGRAVFNFAATHVPDSIARVLAKAELDMDQIDALLLHQGSRYIVETLAKRLRVEDKVLFAATKYGNTVSSSIPMLIAENVPNTAKRVILSGFGVGLSWASCILEKNDDY